MMVGTNGANGEWWRGEEKQEANLKEGGTGGVMYSAHNKTSASKNFYDST